MSVLQVQQGKKSIGARVLFADVNFAINAGEHLGFIGANGAGKTTLFRILAGVDEFDQGQVVRQSGLRLGWLQQEDMSGMNDLVSDFVSQDALLPLWEIKQIGRGLGLTDLDFDRKLNEFSGGFKMRMKLLRLIAQQPDLLLLDEPTNYLDLETLLVLENVLLGFRGAFIVISHDREFLRRTTDHVLELENGEVFKFPGNIDDYFEQKEVLREQLEAKAQSSEAKRKTILDFVSKFGAKATKAKQAQSRLKQLSKMETVELKPLPVRARILIPEPIKTGKSVLMMNEARLGYGDKEILRGVNLELKRGDHLGVVGRNGAGKSTLLKSLSGYLPLISGERTMGGEVTIGYYAQHVTEGLNLQHTVLESMSEAAHRDVLHQQVLDLAGSLLFSGDDIRKKISVLSGGEKARVALGRILLSRAPFLVMDEPTNHLDFQTVEALTQALSDYSGTLILVSHDRGFVRRISKQILEIQGGRAVFYPGTYDEYLWSTQNGVLSEVSVEPDGRELTASGPRRDASLDSVAEVRSGNYKEQKKSLEKSIRELDKKMDQCLKVLAAEKEKIESLQVEILNPQSRSAAEIARELGLALKKAEAIELDWLTTGEERDLQQLELNDLVNGA